MSFIGQRYMARPRRILTKEEASREWMEYGVVYEAEITFDRNLDPNQLAKFATLAISEIKKKHPGIIVNYIEVSGNKLIVQYYDPYEVRAAIPAWVVVIIVAASICTTVAVSVWGAKEVSMTIKDLGKAAYEAITKAPSYIRWPVIIAGLALSVGVSALFIAVLVKAVRGK